MKTTTTKYTLPLTLRDSLEITRDMWDWLSETPEKGKHEWPEFHNGNVPRLSNSCSCCEYTKGTNEQQEVQCFKCPLKSLWGSTSCACTNYTSPYFQWQNTKNSKYAKQIADAARKELAILDEKEKHQDCSFAEAPKQELKQPKYRPWNVGEVPVGAMLKDDCSLKSNIIAACFLRFYYIRENSLVREAMVDGFMYEDALTYIYNLRYSLDNGKTWLPCGVEVKD
jgi:hypothetical protein